jgi:VacB/RNase II family 3'-5' exoribonuclease
MPKTPFDLVGTAERWLADAGFVAGFSQAALKEAESAHLPETLPEGVEDLRDLLWSSVDNAESRDLDQIEVAEKLPNGDIRLLVGIADVDALLPHGGGLEKRAAANTTSVYGGVLLWPMLHERLSTDLTSLNEGKDRLAIVTELVVNPDGTLESSRVFRALVKNHAKLDYESIGVWLDGGDPPPALANNPALAEQVRLQDECADRFAALRKKLGALDLDTFEATPILKSGKIVDMKIVTKSQSRSLIENVMIAVNGATVAWLRSQGFPTLQRVVKTPQRWEKIVEVARVLNVTLPAAPDQKALSEFLARQKKINPAGFAQLSLTVVKLLGPGEYARVAPTEHSGVHFGLAVQGYTHSTAPNRRWADVVTQRLVKAALAGKPCPFTDAQLDAHAERCNLMATAANKVERRIRKAAAASLLHGREGEVFMGVVTGASPKGIFVRLETPAVEGRIVRGEKGLDVGDVVRVKLFSADPERGFIDFGSI